MFRYFASMAGGGSPSARSTLQNIASDSMSSSSYVHVDTEEAQQARRKSPTAKAVPRATAAGSGEPIDVFVIAPHNIILTDSATPRAKQDLQAFVGQLSYKDSGNLPVNCIAAGVDGPIVHDRTRGVYLYRLPLSCHLSYLTDPLAQWNSNATDGQTKLSCAAVSQTFYRAATADPTDDVIAQPWTIRIPQPDNTRLRNRPTALANVAPPAFDWHTAEGLAGMRGYLQEHGYVVIRAAASAAELVSIEAMLWEYLQAVQKDPALHPIRRNDPTTWDGQHWICPRETGVAAAYSVGQADFMHFARGLSSVSDIFSAVWTGESEEMISSFDGCGIFRSPTVNLDWYLPDLRWLHVDQGPRKRGFHCVQGQLCVRGNDETTGTFIVCPDSHKLHDKYMDTLNQAGGDFVMIPEDRWDFFGAPVKLIVQPGDFILWDSRTVHANVPPTLPQTEAEWARHGNGSGGAAFDICRLSLYICFMPLSRVTETEKSGGYNDSSNSNDGNDNGKAKTAAKDIAKDISDRRSEFVEKGWSSTHWPLECRRSGSAMDGYRISPLLQLPANESDVSADELATIKRRRKLCSLDI